MVVVGSEPEFDCSVDWSGGGGTELSLDWSGGGGTELSLNWANVLPVRYFLLTTNAGFGWACDAPVSVRVARVESKLQERI